jgi:hypothetical protein
MRRSIKNWRRIGFEWMARTTNNRMEQAEFLYKAYNLQGVLDGEK